MGRKLNRIAVLSVIAVTALTAVPVVAEADSSDTLLIKQIADEYALPVVLLDSLPDESGICDADLYLNHCLYWNCRLFASNHHICIVSRQTGKGELT